MKFRYETLEIWQLAMRLWERWQKIRITYPKQEQYKLVDQLDRAIEGIGSVIVKGSAKSSTRNFSRYRENIFQGNWFSKVAIQKRLTRFARIPTNGGMIRLSFDIAVQ